MPAAYQEPSTGTASAASIRLTTADADLSTTNSDRLAASDGSDAIGSSTRLDGPESLSQLAHQSAKHRHVFWDFDLETGGDHQKAVDSWFAELGASEVAMEAVAV